MEKAIDLEKTAVLVNFVRRVAAENGSDKPPSRFDYLNYLHENPTERGLLENLPRALEIAVADELETQNGSNFAVLDVFIQLKKEATRR